MGVVSASDGRETAELFGYNRGAFTGAHQGYRGVFEQAQDGTAFLNEIGLASLRVQQLLLDVLDEFSIKRMGDEGSRRLFVRVVTATNVDLAAAVKRGDFRPDLFDRIDGEEITLPSLASHAEDIPELAEVLLAKKAKQAGVAQPHLNAAELDRLMSYGWPGNVRELERVLERYIMHGKLPATIPQRGSGDYWRSQLAAEMLKTGGNKAATAREMGLSRKSVHLESKKQNIG